MSVHPFDTLVIENGAKLIFTPCPGTKEASLNASVATLRAANTDMLLTLIYDAELAKNGASLLPQVCQANQIAWQQLPILDDAKPNHDFEKAWQESKDNILNIIRDKGTVAVHCKGGSGRTGLVIALILLAYGWSPEKIIIEVQNIRPKALKNSDQLNFFKSYC